MLLVTVRARPGARSEKVVLQADGSLLVQVRAPALEGRANQALVLAVARALSLRPRQVRLVRGERSRDKLIEVELDSSDELRSRLADLKSGGE